MKFTQNLARAAMLLLLAVLTSVGARADEAEYLSMPLTLEATANGTTVTFTLDASVVTNPVEYRTWNGTAWTDWATYTSATPVSLNANQKVQFRGENEAYGIYDWEDPIYSNILCDQKCYVYGNIMSLVKKEGFAEAVTLTKHSNFYYLFSNSNIDIDTSKQPRRWLIIAIIICSNAPNWRMLPPCPPRRWQKVAINICSVNAPAWRMLPPCLLLR